MKRVCDSVLLQFFALTCTTAFASKVQYSLSTTSQKHHAPRSRGALLEFKFLQEGKFLEIYFI